MTAESAIRPVVAVFARAPILGHVKTRLAQTVGASAALEAHQELFERTLGVVADMRDVDGELWLDTAAQRPIATEFPTYLQGEGDLGQRMLRVIDDITRRQRLAIVVGSDCPALDAAYLRAAVDALRDGADVVFGPVEDGGYILIGMHRPIPELFIDMTWSTSRVLRQSLVRAASLRLRVTQLPELWDIDTAADLYRWRAIQDR